MAFKVMSSASLLLDILYLPKIACLSPNLTSARLVPSFIIVNVPTLTFTPLIILPLIGKDPETVADVKTSEALAILKPYLLSPSILARTSKVTVLPLLTVNG